MDYSSAGLSARTDTERQPSLSLFSSELSSSSSRPVLPKFDISEIQTGAFLGEGEFGIVYEVQAIYLNGRFTSKRSAAQEKRQYMSENAVRSYSSSLHDSNKATTNGSGNGGLRYAIKQYHPEMIEELEEEKLEKLRNDEMDEMFVSSNSSASRRKKTSGNRSRSDQSSSITTNTEGGKELEFDVLAIEAAFLAVMSHPNIIKMRGISNAYPMSLEFFIVLDCLTETLQDRVHKVWKKQAKKKGLFGKVFGSSKKSAIYDNLLADQCYIAYDICSALRYMHHHNIIYRDLKPQNIGFDVRNDVKLFDFGLSRELPTEDRQDDGMYLMTGHTGSRRYMSPEVALDQPYNTSSDVYSFGLILYEIVFMETPYKDMDASTHLKKIIQKGARPKILPGIPRGLEGVITRCWDADPHKRPMLDNIAPILTEVADNIMGQSGNKISASGRSCGAENRSSQDELSRSERIRRTSKTSFTDAKILEAISGLDIYKDDSD